MILKIEEMIHQMSTKKIKDPTFLHRKSEDLLIAAKIKEKLKQKENQKRNHSVKYPQIKISPTQPIEKKGKPTLLRVFKGLAQDNRRRACLPFFVYNNEKVASNVDIKESLGFLKIEKVNIFEKQQSDQSKSQSSYRSSTKIPKPQRLSQINNEISKQNHQCKLSGFYFKRPNQKNGSKRSITRDSLNITEQTQDFPPRSDLYYNEVLKRHLHAIEEGCRKNGILYKYQTKYEQHERPTYQIEENINSNPIEMAFKKRWWWVQLKQKSKRLQKPCFLWTQLKSEEFFSGNSKFQYPSFLRIDTIQKKRTSEEAPPPRVQIHNHINGSKYVTNKIALFQVSNRVKKNSGIRIPKKYYIHHKTSRFWFKFQNQNFQDYKRVGKSYLLSSRTSSKQTNKSWIVKSAQHQNKNYKLNIYNNLEEISDFLKSHLSCKETFIIEEYITNPFLYKNRKFNVKMFALITKFQNSIKLYWYKEGFLELSTELYDKYSKDPYVHYVSESIQINHSKFGENEESNKISFAQFQQYLSSIGQCSYNFERDALPTMKKTATFVIQSIHSKISNQTRPTFQLLELNYIIDSSFVPWLISTHINPSMQESSLLLSNLYPKMVDDIFKLTLDLYFPPPQIWPKNKLYLLSKSTCENGFEELKLDSANKEMEIFQYENNIDEEKRCYDGGIAQEETALMYFFPEKMRSHSRRSINFIS